MNDYGLYRALVQRLEKILPKVWVSGYLPLDQESPPYIMIQQGPLERAPLPHHTGRRTVTIQIISRYRGEGEISEIEQKISTALEKDVFFLTEEGVALLKKEETSCVLEKDQITRRAQLIFSALFHFKS